MISACTPYHEEIRAYIEQGYSIAAIHRGLQNLGYPHTAEAVRQYVKTTIGIRPPRQHGNQYTATNRCKHGHEWTAESTGWVRSPTRGTYRYCKTCERRRKRARRQGGG